MSDKWRVIGNQTTKRQGEVLTAKCQASGKWPQINASDRLSVVSQLSSLFSARSEVKSFYD
jgi:hypothetical protein